MTTRDSIPTLGLEFLNLVKNSIDNLSKKSYYIYTRLREDKDFLKSSFTPKI